MRYMWPLTGSMNGMHPSFLVFTSPGHRGIPRGIREGRRWACDNQVFTGKFNILRNFVTGLKQDERAVHAALLYPWSNGPIEGHINRLKCLKRLIYGRVKDDLLRKRVSWQGQRPFT